jgi:hypothetical protein
MFFNPMDHLTVASKPPHAPNHPLEVVTNGPKIGMWSLIHGDEHNIYPFKQAQQ